MMSHGLTLTAGGIALEFLAAAVVMAVTALAACVLPAWRATTTGPVCALRD